MQKYASFNLQEYQEGRKTEEDNVQTGSAVWLKFPQGTTVLRVLPCPMTWSEWFRIRKMPPSPFLGYWEHFYEDEDSPGQFVSYVCPKRTTLPGERGRQCPDCTEEWQLTHNSSSKADEQRGKDIRAKYKMACNVYVRQCPDKNLVGTVKAWKMSALSPQMRKRIKEKGPGDVTTKTMFERLEELFLPQVGKRPRDIVTPAASGYDVIVKRVGEKLTTTYSLYLPDDPCPLHEDATKMDEILDSQPDLTFLIHPPTQEQLEIILGASQQRVTQVDRGPKTQQVDLTDYIETTGTVQDDLNF